MDIFLLELFFQIFRGFLTGTAGFQNLFDVPAYLLVFFFRTGTIAGDQALGTPTVMFRPGQQACLLFIQRIVSIYVAGVVPQ